MPGMSAERLEEIRRVVTDGCDYDCTTVRCHDLEDCFAEIERLNAELKASRARVEELENGAYDHEVNAAAEREG